MVDEDGRPTLVERGYKGQLVQHPNLKTADGAEKSYVDALKELGFTPSARSRLGIDATTASSEDGDDLGGLL
jgi:P27 family predicted phage terminase small subunit